MASASEQPVVAEPSADPEADTEQSAADTSADDAADVWLQEQERVISAAIGADPARMYRQISAILDSSFGNDPDVSTMDRLIARLTPVLGDEQATRALLAAIAQCFGDYTYMSRLRTGTDGLDQEGKDLRDWLQELVALYGWPISRALRLEGEDPLGWLTLDRYVYREVVGRQWRVRIVLTLNDGSKVTISDRPDSFAILAEAILNTLAYIPADALAEIMPAPQVDRLSAAYNDFISLLQQPAPVPDATELNEPAPASG
jgi:hypothetical protein